MTSAHRPTWNSAKGKANPGGERTVPSSIISAKNQPGLLQLKRRTNTQLIQKKSTNELKEELQLKENSKYSVKEDNELDYLKLKEEKELIKSKQIPKNEASDNDESSYSSKSINDELANEDIKSDLEDFDEKAKHPEFSNEEDAEDDDEELDDDKDSNEEEDEEEELMREYEKIKKEKEEQKRIKQIEEAEKIKSRTPLEILSGNPIYAQNYSLKRKWYDDTVFKNQAKDEKKPEKRFINDTVRSDFHKKFMYKTIQ